MHYKRLTQYQYDCICNGCGAKGVWLRPPKAKFFKPACDQHDLDYYIGHKERHRGRADSRLKFSMFRIVDQEFCDKSIWNWLQRRRYFTWCRAYYRAVRMFGEKHFFYGEWFQSLPRLNSGINE